MLLLLMLPERRWAHRRACFPAVPFRGETQGIEMTGVRGKNDRALGTIVGPSRLRWLRYADTFGQLRAIFGLPLGYPRAYSGYLRISTGYLRATFGTHSDSDGYLRATFEQLWVTFGLSTSAGREPLFYLQATSPRYLWATFRHLWTPALCSPALTRCRPDPHLTPIAATV